MSGINRRQFFNRSVNSGVSFAAATGMLAGADPARKVSANDKIVLGFVGVRGRGIGLAEGFAERPDCQISYLADVNEKILADRAARVNKVNGQSPKTVTDFRRVLDDKSVDAIVIATPDHWHALATVLGCQAGKDVYVEKPVSHSPWEGRKMVEAARKYKRVVQAGLQNMSAPYNQKAREYIRAGKLGKVHMVRVYNQKLWKNQQAVPDSAVPEGLNWDMWTGPAPKANYNSVLHRRWNHFWRFSGGDIINDGVHQLDLARWLIDRGYPKSVYSIGGRYNSKGVFETPDTHVAVYEYGDLVMTFELTLYTAYMLKTPTYIRQSDSFPNWHQNATRIEIYGDQGVMVIGRHGGGWQVFGSPEGKEQATSVVAQEFGRHPDPLHKQNFFDCIRSRKQPNADIESGHRSTLLCHYANISYRLGGEKLLVDSESERFRNSEKANKMLKRGYRDPWVVPNQV